MTNLEFYKEEINKALRNHDMYPSICTVYKTHYETDGNHVTEMTLLDWLCEEYQILDKEEKEYLSAVIRPFRKRVISLTKSSGIEIKYEKLELVVELPNKSSKTCVRLPYFKKDTMYKGMELDKQYTLEELGL